MTDHINNVQLALVMERGFYREHSISSFTKRLSDAQTMLLKRVVDVGRTNDLMQITGVEKTILKNELAYYANSKSMADSLNKALSQMNAAERLIGIVDNKDAYRAIDQAYSLKDNRKQGLPLDEARQAFASHAARLGNLDKARLSEEEKGIIDARKRNMTLAGKLYAERQAKTLGVSLPEKSPKPPASIIRKSAAKDDTREIGDDGGRE